MESLPAMVSWACRSLVPKALRALRVLAQRWVKETLKRRKVINSDSLTPFKVPLPPPSKQEQQKFFEMRDKQWQAFCQRLQMQGRVPAMGPWMWRRREAAADDGMAGIFGWLPRLTLDICRETSGSCRVSMIVDCHRNHDIQTESWWKQDSTQTTETNFQRRGELVKGDEMLQKCQYLLPTALLRTIYPFPTTHYLLLTLLPPTLPGSQH